VREAFFIVEPNRAQLAEVASLIDGGELRPTVAKVFPLSQAREAYQYKPGNGKVALSNCVIVQRRTDVQTSQDFSFGPAGESKLVHDSADGPMFIGAKGQDPNVR
jgi:hypothetical protein